VYNFINFATLFAKLLGHAFPTERATSSSICWPHASHYFRACS